MNIIRLIIIAGLISSPGCTFRVMDFTLISTKNIDISNFSSYQRGSDRIEGNHTIKWILLIPTGTVSIEEAVDNTIESIPGCVALLDGVIYTYMWSAIVYAKQMAVVEGTPLIDPNLGKGNIEFNNYGIIELDKGGEIKSTEIISEEEFLALRSRIHKDDINGE